MQTHGQTIRAFASWADVVGLREGDRYLIINPFFHAFGYKAGIVACLLTGAVMVPLPVFDVPAAMSLIGVEHISMIPGPPTIYQTIINHPERAALDTTSLRLAVTGAAAIPVSLVEQMWDDLGFETVVTGYGLTEACGIATMCRHDDDAETIATTSGRAIPDVEVQVVDDDGHEVPRGEPGEIVIRGYNVMSEYFEEPEQSEEAIDLDGWLHTGDVGTMDERGYIRITDRKKDMFISGGFNAYPAEIEGLLLRHPDLAQVAVVGVPDERMGEVGVAAFGGSAHNGTTARSTSMPRSSPGPATRWPTSRCPAGSWWSDTPCRSTCRRQGPEVRAARSSDRLEGGRCVMPPPSPTPPTPGTTATIPPELVVTLLASRGSSLGATSAAARLQAQVLRRWQASPGTARWFDVAWA